MRRRRHVVAASDIKLDLVVPSAVLLDWFRRDRADADEGRERERLSYPDEVVDLELLGRACQVCDTFGLIFLMSSRGESS